MKISRIFGWEPIAWHCLSELPAKLSRHGLSLTKSTVELVSYPDTFGLDNLEDATKLVADGFDPFHYTIWVYCRDGDGKRVDLCIRRVANKFGDRYHDIQIEGTSDRTLIESIAHFLSLRPAEFASPSPRRTVFLAHRFDDLGTLCADRLARFLELVGFTVVSGRGFAPISVSEKVKARLLSQAIVVVLLTPGDDSTWLIQESILGEATEKPLIVIRDTTTTFKPALLGDREYIPFTGSAIEATFTPLLEGLRELGYSFSHGDSQA